MILSLLTYRKIILATTIFLDLFGESHYCFEDNLKNEGISHQTRFIVSSVLMCQFECQNTKGRLQTDMTIFKQVLVRLQGNNL